MDDDDRLEKVLQQILDGPATPLVRMQMLGNPTTAQIKAIPDGSEVIMTHTEVAMFGVMTENSRQELLDAIRDQETGCDHLHGQLIYDPPRTVVPDSALTADQIADRQMRAFEANRSRGVTNELLHTMLSAAVHEAREGMVFNPF